MVSFYQLMNAHDANSTILFPVIFLNHMHVVTEDANNCYVFREKANLPKTSTCIAVGQVHLQTAMLDGRANIT